MRVPFLWHISRFWPLWKYYYFWKLTKLRNCCNRALFDLYFNAEEDSAVARCWWSKRGNTSHSPTTHCALRSLLGMRMMIMTMLGSRIFQVVCLCGNLHDIRRSSPLSALLLDGWRVHCNVDMSFCRNFTKPRLTLPNPNHDHRRWLIETTRRLLCLSVWIWDCYYWERKRILGDIVLGRIKINQLNILLWKAAAQRTRRKQMSDVGATKKGQNSLSFFVLQKRRKANH